MIDGLILRRWDAKQPSRCSFIEIAFFLPLATSFRAYFSLFLHALFFPKRVSFIWQSRSLLNSGRAAAWAVCWAWADFLEDDVAAGS